MAQPTNVFKGKFERAGCEPQPAPGEILYVPYLAPNCSREPDVDSRSAPLGRMLPGGVVPSRKI